MQSKYIIDIVTPDNLDEFVNLVKDYIKVSDIVCLEGELGAGKTTFVKAFLKSYNFYNVSSPTFSIINEYKLKDFDVLHVDFYRVENVKSFIDYIKEKQNESITFVEWPKEIECTKTLSIKDVGKNRRLFKLCL
ncbi:MAG: tRNA (adenosine(37)-N6)-threonylcarbamoyltransferase complex ATPase subunit type 1 TsaE [Hydrogenobaculum sp.]